MNAVKALPIQIIVLAVLVVSTGVEAAPAEFNCAKLLEGTSTTFISAPARKDSYSNTNSESSRLPERQNSARQNPAKQKTNDDWDYEPEYESPRRSSRNESRKSGQSRKNDIFGSMQTESLPDLSPVRTKAFRVSRLEGEAFFPNENASLPSVIHQIQIASHSIDVIIPKGAGLEWSANGIIQTLTKLPASRIEALHTVRVNPRESEQDAYWRETYKDFNHAAAAAGEGQIDIFSSAVEIFAKANAESLRITRHEFGHLIASQIGGSLHPPKKYVKQAEKDRSSVSDYGDNNWAEDFAEGIEAYLRTNAGRMDLRLRTTLQRRFAFFDDLFNDRMPQSTGMSVQRQQPPQKPKPAVIVAMISATHIIAIAPELGVGLLLELN